MKINNTRIATFSSERTILEQNAIGGLITFGRNHELAVELFGVIQPHMFMSLTCKEIAQAVEVLTKNGEVIDSVTVYQQMKRNGSGVDQYTFSQVVRDASNCVISRAGVIRAAESVRKAYTLESARVHLQRAYDATFNMEVGIDNALSGAKDVLAVLEDTTTTDDTGIEQIATEYFNGLLDGEGCKRPVPTPWGDLNRVLRGGMLPGELCVLAARPSVGKSAFALNLALSASSHQPVYISSLEMPKNQLVDRAVACIGNLDVGIFRSGHAAQNMGKIQKSIEILRTKKLEISDCSRMKTMDIARDCRRVKAKHGGLGMVIVDYLQLVTPSERTGSREQDVASMSREFKQMAKELDVPVVILAQLNRKVEESKRDPMLSDLRESGAIEQDADIVIFLNQSGNVGSWNPNEPLKVIVAKGRSSGVGSCYLTFKRREQRIEDGTESAYEKLAGGNDETDSL